MTTDPTLSPDAAAGPLVLVVDDEPVNIRVLDKMLTGAGFSVLSALDGETARAMARERLPDLILLDVMMPGENGFETCLGLKRDPGSRDIPVIFISALSDVENKVRGLEMGAVDFVGKPFEKAEVLARIRVHIKLKRAMRALVEEQSAKLRSLAEAQRSILVDPEDCPEAGFGVYYEPILEAGGDFYDVFGLGPNRHCYFVADICGHDLGASLVTSSLKALVRQNSGPLYTPVETMETINSVLGSFIQPGRYVTAQFLLLDRRVNSLALVNAGHPAPVYVPSRGVPALLEAEGDILGAFGTVYLEQRQAKVAKGDRIFLYTDGLMERLDGQGLGRRKGMEELVRLCGETRGLPLAAALDEVVDAMFTGGRLRKDDVILLGIEV